MPKGTKALTYLPAAKIVYNGGEPSSIQAVREAFYTIAKMQELELDGDPEYPSVVGGDAKPFGVYPITTGSVPSKRLYDILINIGDIGGDYQITPVGSLEDDPLSDTIGRTALSTRRYVSIGINEAVSAFSFTVRSVLAALTIVEQFEDLVAANGGIGTTGDVTSKTVKTGSVTPFNTYEWILTKANSVYTLVPTANS